VITKPRLHNCINAHPRRVIADAYPCAMASFEHDGVTLGFDDDGSGPPIVLLHGLSMSRRTWDRFVSDLRERFRVIQLDQRGHGESSHAPGTYVLDTYLSDTVAFLEKVARGPSMLVGHSLGGVIAHGVAQTRPDLVRNIMLEDPPLYVTDRMRSGLERDEASPIARMFPVMRQLSRDMQARNAPLDEWITMLSGVPALNGRGTMAEVLGPDGTNALAEAFSRLDPEIFTPAIEGTAIAGTPDLSKALGCPAVVLRGDPALGPAFTAEDEERFLRTKPHARVVLVEGASHQIHDEQPERFLHELRSAAAILSA
jgi:pimeloyl-ACP methyl ester carboxylesterase